MKVLLINPPIPKIINNKDIWVPINLMYIGAVLKRNGIEVEILDLNIEQDSGAVSKKVKDCSPDIVGITCIFSGQFPDLCEVAQSVKSISKDIVIAIGGIHPTLYVEKILNGCQDIDWVILGEGEYSFLEAVMSHISDSGLNHIDGIGFRENGDLVINDKTEFIRDLDALPIPDYSLINLDDYKLDTCGWHNPRNLPIDYMIPILSSRSCPMKCNFCSMFLAMGTKQRYRSPIKVVDEIEYLYDRYGCRRFAFTDDNLTLGKSHIKKICEEILRRNLVMQFETPNGIALSGLDEEIISLMVRAGLVRVSLAIESGSDYVRNKVIGKHLKKEKIYEVIDLFKQYPDVYIKAFFIIGMPEDTLETLEATYNMIEEIDIEHPCVSNLLPFPGTKLFSQVIRDGLLIEGMREEELWRYPNFYFAGNKSFFVEPYDMKISELEEFRKRIDSLVEKVMNKNAKVN